MKLYVYDHCPYCVKARMIFGLKRVPFELVTLLNDDVETPTRLIGKKMVPILEKDDGSCMPESMDIIHFIDRHYGGDAVVAPAPEASPVQAWLDRIRSHVYPLAMPRWVQAPLEEFATKGARNYFIEKKEGMIGSFHERMKETELHRENVIDELLTLESHIQSPDAVQGQLTEDDFHVFAALRSLTIVRGLIFPPRVNEYARNMAVKSNIPLHWNIAI